MHVLTVQFDGWPVGRFGQPDVQVLAFARLEEHDVVAVVEVGELVELVEARFGVEFSVFAAVGEEGVQVGEEVAVSGYVGISRSGVGEDVWLSAHTDM